MKRDQFITEKVMGKCWHEPAMIGRTYREGVHTVHEKACIRCGHYFREDWKGYDYSTSPKDILALQQFVMGAEWWGEFEHYAKMRWMSESHGLQGRVKWLLSDPDRFADLVAEYRGWKP